MSRHYWPGPPTSSTEYLVEHKSGEVHRLTLDIDNEWSGDRFQEWSRENLIRNGYLGVRTPFSEEAERAAFEAEFPLPQGHDEMDLHVQCEQWRAWLAAKRHERGV